MTADEVEELSKEDYSNEIKRIEDLLLECLKLNDCFPVAANSAMLGIIMNSLLAYKVEWTQVQNYFDAVLDKSKPFFVTDS